MKKIIISFTGNNEAQLQLSSQTILHGMTDNKFFVKLKDYIDMLREVFDIYVTALVASKDGGKVVIRAKNNAKTNLMEEMEALGYMVCGTARGNMDMLSTKGYPLAKSNKGKGKKLVSAEGLDISKGNAATDVVLKVMLGLKNAPAFLYSYTADDPAVVAEPKWITKPSRSKTYTFSDVPLYKKLWFKVEAIGKNNEIVYSNTLLYIAF